MAHVGLAPEEHTILMPDTRMLVFLVHWVHIQVAAIQRRSARIVILEVQHIG